MKDTNINQKEQLKIRLQEAKKELLYVLDDWHYLQNILKPRLDFTYDAIFGDLEFELNCRLSHAKELDRKIEIISLKLNRGEKINISNLNTMIDKEKKNQSEILNKWNISKPQVNTDEIGTLFRKLAKKIHPDTAGEDNEYLQFWENVQSSYKSGNYERIKLFYQTICKDINEEARNETEEISYLNSEINNIEYNIKSEKMKIEKLKNEEPFCFQDRFKDNSWIIARKKQIQDRIMYIDLKIQRNKRYLSRYEQSEPLVSYFQTNSKNSYNSSYAS